MKKSLALLIITVFITAGTSDDVFAGGKEESPTLEQTYSEIGYKTVEEACKEFEEHFKQDVKLPLRVPPIPFSHQFGRFNDLEDDINDSFDMDFINEDSPENHYKLDIRPINRKISINKKYFVNQYTLKNGKEATLINIANSFDAIVFEIGPWQYMLSVDKRVSDIVTVEILLDIANSIDYLSEDKRS
ncbi:hypothetical protein RYX45_16080 [Alkalihalophilus pseudofirmus]|uniref:Uncharacterized protein n=1 Tax=Alkalihalophilus pseudofirmus TaxID=79885 RepID=A0AAJ2U4K3_ALKPS|nr:hypothetical protein [Alkalihalophilus pseudofirmus]MDV2886712.1 hypothetical protein [Alkalihalophilus pseudofirmus]